MLRNTGGYQGFLGGVSGDLSPKTAKRLAGAQGRRGPKGPHLLRARTLMPHLRSGIGITARIEGRAWSVPAHARVEHTVRVFTRPRLTPGVGGCVTSPPHGGERCRGGFDAHVQAHVLLRVWSAVLFALASALVKMGVRL